MWLWTHDYNLLFCSIFSPPVEQIIDNSTLMFCFQSFSVLCSFVVKHHFPVLHEGQFPTTLCTPAAEIAFPLKSSVCIDPSAV